MSISWRDLWAFVTVKGVGPLGEDVGKSVDTQSWGSAVTVQVKVPIKDSSGDHPANFTCVN